MEDATECSHFNAKSLKRSNQGSSLMEVVMTMMIIATIMVVSITSFHSIKQQVEDSKNPAIAATQKDIEAKKPVYTEPHTLAVAKPKEVIKPEPIIEKVTENHHHFEALSNGLKFLGVVILGLFTLFTLKTIISLIKNIFIVSKATRESKKILASFDKDFGDAKKQLVFTRDMADQIIVNNILIDGRKNKESITQLIVNNEKLKERLGFLESKLVNKYGVRI